MDTQGTHTPAVSRPRANSAGAPLLSSGFASTPALAAASAAAADVTHQDGGQSPAPFFGHHVAQETPPPPAQPPQDLPLTPPPLATWPSRRLPRSPVFTGKTGVDIEKWKQDVLAASQEVQAIDGPDTFGPVDLAILIRNKVTVEVRDILRAKPLWVTDSTNPQ
uniref:Uncharacterized protein n=1 Tax=Chromera velia CCMP2878 TaxID=1169474 RepID=A0A0G4GJE1_9ALVE|eukprot:Cvel_22128.t1-p1 / transcript=Cvel_22128.t1 / gene=Cvel_22128 / organism=Chromera_velia_CCMP2878 / gene_product=hypothetical protein / transcript_product=hypothetical protein / location=Cvel_scaffold2145:12380-13017(+) / protein_length=163 / sequence_SO=supercontig / SO=protein_coding / is_pseudo=false